MYTWRITKYNPLFRNQNDIYLKNEWTSFSDIGKLFENEPFIFKDYLKTENAYIVAIVSFLECNNLDSLIIKNLEKYTAWEGGIFNVNEMKNIFEIASEGLSIDKNSIKTIARLILREKLWCKLESEKMYVHFGWDYYMYIGSSIFCKENIEKITQSGLFIEHCPSPYAVQ